MNQMQRSTLEAYLEKFGWTYTKLNPNTLASGFQSEQHYFPLLLTVCDSFLCFRVAPLLPIAIDWESWPELASFVLELNANSVFVRLASSAEGIIELQAEILQLGMTYETFAMSLGLVTHHTDNFYEAVIDKLDALGFNYSRAFDRMA